MALFDFLKKKPTQQEPTNPVQPAKPVVPVSQPSQPPREPDRPVQERPVPPVSTAGNPPARNKDHVPQHPRRPQQPVQWPAYGTTVEALVSAIQVRVFVDASFVKSPAFATFSRLWKQYRVDRYATRFYFIPSYEKQKLSADELATLSAEDCREFQAQNPEDCFAQMLAKGLRWNILWLTQSSELGTVAQNAARKTNAIYLRWYGMDQEGKLKSLFTPGQDRRSSDRSPVSEKAEPMLFPHATQLVQIGRTPNPVTAVPGKGAVVTATGTEKRYTLREPVMTDHSSITFKTDDAAYFAKIYTAAALRIDLFENKAKRMTQQKIDLPGVCWPQDILKDGSGRFVGILVPASAGVQLSQSIFNGTSGLKKHFPNWDKRDICAVALTILRTVCALQKKGILFGCFNPASVYIVSTDRVYFVDADTWQLEGFPVLSRNLTFTPPELLGDPQKVRLFTADEDKYQTALLAFMLMMPGKYPYAKKNRKTDDDSLRNMSFPFSIGGDLRRSQDAERPSGAWQIVWDHLPYKLCQNFYHSFHQAGSFSKPGTRLRSSTWIEQIEYFGKHLQTAEGAQSRVLFPATFRKDGKRTFIRCKECGQEHPEFYFLRKLRIQGEVVNIWDRGYRVCLPCAVDKANAPDAQFTCQCCKKPFYYTNRTYIMHQIGKLDFDWGKQKWCSACKKRTVPCGRCGKDTPIYQFKDYRDERRNLTKSVCGTCFSELLNEEKRRKEAVYTVIHGKCGHSFSITFGEKEFYERKGYSLPTRCPRCRGK